MRLLLPLALLASVGCTYDELQVGGPFLTGMLSVDRPVGVLADGNDQAEIRVIVLDSNDQPRAAAVVTLEFEAGAADAELTQPEPTGADGATAGFIVASRPGVRQLRAVVKTGIEDVRLPGSVSISFVGDASATVEFDSPAVTVSPAPPSAMASADIEGDGFDDLMVVSATAASAAYFRGARDGLAEPEITLLDEQPRAIALGEIDDDGTAEALIVHPAIDQMSVLRVQGGHFEVVRTLDTCERPRDVALLELDGPPLDVAVACANEGAVSYAVETGTSQIFDDFVSIDAGLVPMALAVGALDEAARPGLAVANQSSATVDIFGWDLGTALAPVSTVPVAGVPVDLVLDDLDMDGDADLAVLSGLDKTLTVYLQEPPDPSFVALPALFFGAAPVAVAHGDLNRDGRLDLAVATRDDTAVHVFLGDGSGAFAAATSLAVGAAPTAVALGDWNGDGLTDVAAASELGARLVVFYGK